MSTRGDTALPRGLAMLALIAVCGCSLIAPVAKTEPKVLMIFGGEGHRVYLGCISCDSTSQLSVFNREGEYGSCRPTRDSLFCRGPLAQYGAASTLGQLSACSDYSKDPPVIVDNRGGYYGRFSVGGAFAHRDAVCSLLGRFKSDELCALVGYACGRSTR